MEIWLFANSSSLPKSQPIIFFIHDTIPFTESGLFKVENHLYIKNHFVLNVNNSTWELTGKNLSKTIRTFCIPNGSWENIEFFNNVSS